MLVWSVNSDFRFFFLFSGLYLDLFIAQETRAHLIFESHVGRDRSSTEWITEVSEQLGNITVWLAFSKGLESSIRWARKSSLLNRIITLRNEWPKPCWTKWERKGSSSECNDVADLERESTKYSLDGIGKKRCHALISCLKSSTKNQPELMSWILHL